VRVCVFCGSRPGDDPAYLAAAREIGAALARRGIGVVYGGGHVGCMGALADATLEAGGEVIGVIPRMLAEREVAHEGVTDLHVVESMHDRKALMASLSDAFVALPGGFGTLEELFEVVTWRQLGYHRKPIAVLNARGYFNALLRFCDDAVAAGFVDGAERDALLRFTELEPLLERLFALLGSAAP
jgi:uncharacterized protein (TIGR00730 family)